MKTHLGIILLLLTSSISSGFSQSWSAPIQWGGNANETCDAMTIGQDGNILLAGTFRSEFQLGSQTLDAQGETDIFFMKTNANGDVQWATSVGSRLGDAVADIATDSEDNLIAVGSFWLDANFSDTILTATQNSKALFLVKYNLDGQLQWAQAINGTNLKSVEALAIDATNQIWITGYFSDSLTIADTMLVAAGDTDFFVAKFDPAGELTWALRQGQSGDTRGLAMELTSEGDAIITGFFNDTALIAQDTLVANTQDRDLFVTRISKNGEPLWARRAGGVFDKDPVALVLDDADNIYITGFLVGVMTLSETLSIQSKTGNSDFFIAKYSSDGNPLAARAFGGTLPQQPTDITMQGNHVVITGFYQGDMAFDGFGFSAGMSVHSFVAAFDANLQTTWAKDIATDQSVFATQIALDEQDNLWISGSFQGQTTFDDFSINANSFDIFLAKLNPNATSISNQVFQSMYFLAFPNPVSEILLIQTKIDNYTVELYDSTGRQVFRAANPQKIDIQSFTNGIYLLYFKYDQKTEVQRIVVSRKD